MDALILVGGGHAHLNVIKNMKYSLKTKLQVILISSMDKQYYSGMAAGSLEGYYSEDQMTVDLPDYCNKHQIKFIKSTVVLVEPELNYIVLSTGQRITYNYISFDIGSIARTDLTIKESECFYVKPLNLINEIKEKILSFKEQNDQSKTITMIVVGTGAAGIEIGLAARALAKSKNISLKLIFVGSSFRILNQDIAERGKKFLTTQAVWHEIDWVLNDPGVEIEQNALILKSGKKLDFDLILLATGITGGRLFKDSIIKTDKNDFMVVNKYLQNENYPNILGAGDCVTLNSKVRIPKNGVYAIKQSKVLSRNLENLIYGKSLIPFKPQKVFLTIVALGYGMARLEYGSIVWTGRIPFLLKKWIDQNYMFKLKTAKRKR